MQIERLVAKIIFLAYLVFPWQLNTKHMRNRWATERAKQLSNNYQTIAKKQKNTKKIQRKYKEKEKENFFRTATCVA